ncbi:putative Tryptophan synthase beta superfamily [Vibrio tapetis subsp. tapetis]|uniref:Putative Tryptophan synthase beta superfamily n=2 Tax=Vibrio tapetis TaxID=52443 RepID=A0A2N8ZAI2_9VIBR|nr:putative Tryptophan synthase beta superfamily [Vibrio tapetis subsp. tapetis]
MQPNQMKLCHTETSLHQFEQYSFWLKRDDLLHPQFSGNKARKLASLLEVDASQYDTLIGYGSVQANSLYSLAALAQLTSWQLEFYVDRIPTWLKQSPIGNYRAALELGANIIDLSQCGDRSDRHPSDYISQVRLPDSRALFVPEGGRSPIAEAGIKVLAEEIIAWRDENNINDLVVALPSGTGTTSLYLHKHLNDNAIEVITCACVGGNDYLEKQWLELGESSVPNIINSGKPHHFGKLYREDYETWLDLKDQTGVEFELLYDPLMWQALRHWLPENAHRSLLYIHQGGLLGNETMLPRYRRKYPQEPI